MLEKDFSEDDNLEQNRFREQFERKKIIHLRQTGLDAVIHYQGLLMVQFLSKQPNMIYLSFSVKFVSF